MFSITFQLVTKILCFFRYVIKLPTDLVDFFGVSASQNEDLLRGFGYFSDVSLAIKVCRRRFGRGSRDDGSGEGLRGRKFFFSSFCFPQCLWRLLFGEMFLYHMNCISDDVFS